MTYPDDYYDALGESMRDGTYWTEDDYDYFATVAENAIARNHERVQDALDRADSLAASTGGE